MKNYFIFQYVDLISSEDITKVTVIYVHQETINSQNTLAQEINKFFQKNSLTDKLVILLPEYIDAKSKSFFLENCEETFIRIPGKSKEYFDENLIVYSFNCKGETSRLSGKQPINEIKFIKTLFRNGNTIIFQKNGGIVESTADHHFVFPSNKHCSKFLRTGNILINQSEVFFIAIQLLSFFDDIKYVYCDTSSINTLPYAVLELKRRFDIRFSSPTIFSFSSYDLFETHEQKFPHDSLILISSSTSGNIIDRIIKEHRAEKEQIKVLFFLGTDDKYLSKKENIICNLTFQENIFPNGEEIFESSENSVDCKLCANNSRPIHIRGDVFLTIQPKVYKHLLTVKTECIPTNINPFVDEFRDKTNENPVIKVFHKDNNPNANYEIYFDFINLISKIDNYSKYRNSLNKLINKHIPANTKYIIHLPDEGSLKLSEYILDKIPKTISPKLVNIENDFITHLSNSDIGSVLVVASCITTGKKLLQISRLMRKFENLDLIYFVGIFRPNNESFATDLINDLKKGKNKSDEKPFIAVETLNASIVQQNSSWANEIKFTEKLLAEVEDESQLYIFFNDRFDTLRKNKNSRGLTDDVFLNKYDNSKLYLRKSFAFWKFNYNEKDIRQSEVYFTISSIINNLENHDINTHPSLKQTNYVRNLLSPRNFHRFNDGIIQASLLRSSKIDYLSYDLDEEANLQMKEFLLTIISKYDSEDGEALLEFLLAIGMKKLKLKNSDIKIILEEAILCDNIIVSEFATYIRDFSI